MNEIVKFAGSSLPVTPEALEKGLQNVAQTLGSASSGTPYLRLLKSGVFAYGPEGIEPEPGSEWAVNPGSLQHGFACWGDGELIDERMVPFNAPLPNPAELPDYGFPWDQQVAVTLQCMTGEDTGTSVLYKGTSRGLRDAIKELITALIGQLQTDPGHCVPVVLLEVDSYTHKKYGQIFTPVLEIVRWLSYDGTESAAGALPDEGAGETREDESSGGGDSSNAGPDKAAADRTAPARRRRTASTGKAATQAAPAGNSARQPGNRRRRRVAS